jgi:hypothetical protein
MHGLLALFLGVIALVIILLFVGLAALRVLVVAPKTIIALIVSMTILGLAIVAIALVALMVVGMYMTTMLPVAQFMAKRGSKLSHVLLFWLLLVLSDLLENASHLVGCLTLLEESNQLEQVSRDRLVQVCKLELMRLGLCKEDLFTLLLCHWYFRRSTEVATLEVAEKLYSMLHELVHWHESRLLGSTKPVDQLVAYIWKTSNSLEIIPDALVKVCLHTIYLVWASLCNDAGLLDLWNPKAYYWRETKGFPPYWDNP